MEAENRETRREDAGKELDKKVNELTDLMKIFRNKVDDLEKTVQSLEGKVVDYVRVISKAKDEIEVQDYSTKQ